MTELDTARFEEIPEGTGKLTRVLAITFIVFATAFWLFAFSPWARDIFTAPDQLNDEVLVQDLEQRCEMGRDAIADLQPASLAESPVERAVVVAEATVALEAMVADLGQVQPDDADNARRLRMWLADWQIYLGDRRAHAERLANGDDVRFLNTEDNGVYVRERMDGFARVNDLDACETPGDI